MRMSLCPLFEEPSPAAPSCSPSSWSPRVRMGKLIFPWILLIAAIIVRLAMGAPFKNRQARVDRPSICANQCEMQDHIGNCRTSLSCLLESNIGANIIRGGGCAHCRRPDHTNKCRVVLSCLMGY